MKPKIGLEYATRLAEKNPIRPKGRNSISRFATVITDGSRVFHGWNSYKSSPLQKKYAEKSGNPERIHIHSEISALQKASRSGIIPDRATVYIARVLSDGTPALSKPCKGCLMALTEFGYKNIYWTE